MLNAPKKWIKRWSAARAARPVIDRRSGLGVAGLPPGLGGLPVGTLTALLLRGQALERLWMQALLTDALKQGPVFVLAHQAGLVDGWLEDAGLRQAYDSGRLRVSLMAPALTSGLQPAPVAGLLDELAAAGLGPDDLLLVAGWPSFFVGPKVRNFRRWTVQMANWSRRRRCPVLLCWDIRGDAELALGPLRNVADLVEHVAQLGQEAQHGVLYLERWNTAEGPVFEARFGLRLEATSKTLVYDGSQARGPAQRLVEAPDQFDVICTRAALAGQRSAPASWQVLEPETDLLEATQNAIAATLLLDGGASAEIDHLLRQVHALRLAHGRALKIVVRETQDKLRANVEQALLHLGANQVAYRELGFARLVNLIDDLSDATYVREINADFDAARGAFMPDPVRGYLPPQRFCETVLAMLERTGQRGLKHSFLGLTMQRHVAHLDAIQACTALRDGDVISADQGSLYVFMFACAESDVDAALRRLFSIAPAELFDAQIAYKDEDSVRTCLRDLQSAAQSGLPDYSAMLAPELPRTVARQSGIDAQTFTAAAQASLAGAALPQSGPALPASEAKRLEVRVRALPRLRQLPSAGGTDAG